MFEKGVYIPSIDGKDLFLANNLIDENLCGYKIRAEDGNALYGRFINTLDYSLELCKLKEIYQKVYGENKFSWKKGDKKYSKHVINVTFKYSVKEFNRIWDNTFVRFGYPESVASLFSDCIVLNSEGELIAIKIGEKVESPVGPGILGKYFYYEDGVYCAKKNIPTIKSVAEIRESLYVNGFICDGIKYVRYKRSAGSSRTGKCLFINEKLYPLIHAWEMCGIQIEEGQEVDLAALESYISLTLSSIIGKIKIYPENILVIDDYESVFKDNVIATRIDENNRLYSLPEYTEITNNIWDGQSLMDRSFFLSFLGEHRIFDSDAKEKGMLLLRSRFFKSCCFNTNIQKWFQDNDITDVSQLNGKTRAKSIEDIKIITTPSSIKYLKFGSLDDWLDNLEPDFGVVKYEKPTFLFDGRMVPIHYQLLNTLQLSYEEVEELVKPYLDYVRLIKTDPAFLRYQIKYQYFSEADGKLENGTSTKNDIIYRMLSINDKFQYTKLYQDFCNDLVASLIKNLRCGHIWVRGNYSTICGNPIEMLKESIGKFDGETVIKPGTIHTINFENNEEILGSRSPHCTYGNILITKNILRDEIDKYLNSTTEIVYVNSIGENTLERLSGADCLKESA